MVITHNSQNLKFMIQQKVLNKKTTEWYIQIFFIPMKNHFLGVLNAKNMQFTELSQRFKKF